MAFDVYQYTLLPDRPLTLENVSGDHTKLFQLKNLGPSTLALYTADRDNPADWAGHSYPLEPGESVQVPYAGTEAYVPTVMNMFPGMGNTIRILAPR